MRRNIAVLPGDGIGPEVVGEAVKVLQVVDPSVELEYALLGGIAYDQTGHPCPDATLDTCRKADAVLLGAVGGPKWDSVQPVSLRPEVGGLLRIRRELNLYANLRPAKTHGPLQSASPLKPEMGQMDLLVVRELTGGIYFGEPRERRNDGTTAIDTCVYHRYEIERIVRNAFEVAMRRRKNLVSVDKANVLETSRLWREIVNEIAPEYPEVKVSHMLVDNCAMQMIRNPGQFDVIVTENMFGDILSDEASMITGSLGLLPSASLSDGAFGLYEPIHGSAPDIAGQGKANPIATILSVAMMYRFTFGDLETAGRIESAVDKVLAAGLRTPDIADGLCTVVGTEEMGRAIVSALA